MGKIRVKTPLVEMDGDEMTRVMWQMVKDKLILPFLDIDLDYYDLHVQHRDRTADRVTVDAARANMKYGVSVKCATITPDAGRVTEYNLQKQWKSPNGTIRAMLDGTVFRTPILVKNVKPAVANWKKPITIGRHAYGDVYKNAEFRVPGAGRAELVFTPEGGGPVQRVEIENLQGPGIIQGIHNTDESIRSFASACFTYALDRRLDVWFGTKDTISKTYDARFRQVFEEVYGTEFRQRFEAAGITFFYTLIDDIVARIMKSEGGMLWACKNYDGDVMSDMLASAFGSLAMMTSVLVSPKGYYEFEAAHGTVQRHYYQHLKGERTSTNSMALIFAWTGGLAKRGELDGTPAVVNFARQLEAASLQAVESGEMTKDLIPLVDVKPARALYTDEFIDAIAARLKAKLA